MTSDPKDTVQIRLAERRRNFVGEALATAAGPGLAGFGRGGRDGRDGGGGATSGEREEGEEGEAAHEEVRDER